MPVTQVGAYEAKTHLPRLLDEVEAGQSITITKHGRPVARLVPVEADLAFTSDVIVELKAARAALSLGGDSVRELIDEGRR